VLQRGLAISGLYCCCALGMWYWCEAALVYMGQVGLCTGYVPLKLFTGGCHVLHLRAFWAGFEVVGGGLYCCCALGMWYWCEAALVYMGQVGLCTAMLSLPVHGRLHVLCLRAKGLLLKLWGVGCTAAARWACGIGARQHWCTWDRCAALSVCFRFDIWFVYVGLFALWCFGLVGVVLQRCLGASGLWLKRAHCRRWQHLPTCEPVKPQMQS
jgi:hypothetical protein